MVWYYLEDGNQKGPVSEGELSSLIRDGQISAEGLIWKEGMAEWQSVASVFPQQIPPPAQTAICSVSGVERPVSEMMQYGDQFVAPEYKNQFVQTLGEGQPIQQQRPIVRHGYHYRDPRKPALVTKILFIALTAVELAMLPATLMSDPTSPELAPVDGVLAILGILYTTVFVVGIVFYCIWKVRVAKNARVLGTSNSLQFHPGDHMTISPGWAVGFYFIPIVSLWKPFQAMNEIWEVTFSGTSRQETSIIGWWWFCWIVSGIAGHVSFRTAMSGNFEVSLIADIVGVVVAIPLLCAILWIMNGITKRQVELANEPSLNIPST